MPRIPMPKRQVKPPTQGSDVPLSAYPGSAQQEGRAFERLGSVLSSAGGEFATLANRFIASQQEQEKAEFVTFMNQRKGMYEEGIKAEGTTNPVEYSEKASLEYDKMMNEFKFTTPRVQREAQLWAANDKLRWKQHMMTEGMKEGVKRVKGSLGQQSVLMTTEEFDEHLETQQSLGVLTPDEVIKWKYLKRERGIIERVETHGLETAREEIDLMRDLDIITSEQKAELIRVAEKSALVLKAKEKMVSEEETRQATIELSKKPPLEWKQGDLAGIGDRKEQKEYEKAYDNNNKSNPSRKEVDPRELVRLQDKMPSFWEGKSKAIIDDKEDDLYIHTEVIKARYSDRVINDDMKASIDSMMKTEIRSDYIPMIEKAFEQIKLLSVPGSGRSFFGLKRGLGKEGAKVAAQARKTLVDWLVNERIRKDKETTEKDIIIKARELVTIFRKPEEAILPTTQEEYDAIELGTPYRQTAGGQIFIKK